ncbi:MAG: DUF1549 domain-containing protein, partial [Planctomycetaceae bacterium]|nr:DUF1549 domain-containing protein [Planctomycetaceae bacterium]
PGFGLLNKLLGFAVLLMTCGIAAGQVKQSVAIAEKPQDEVATVAALIDRQINQRLEDEGIEPAPLADDAEFLRRVYLDVGGRIPSVAEAREFLADTSPDKRRRVVERLLEEAGYITHFATVWRKVLLPESDTDFNTRFRVVGFEAWLRERFTQNTPYDEMVKQMLTAPIDGQAVSAAAFFQVKDVKPENLAASTSRMFLGVRLECAQCHNHPFDRWEQKQFWEFAAFFAGMELNTRGGGASRIREFFRKRTLTIPETDTVVYPTDLDGNRPQINLGQSSREALAEWVTAKDNPYFARMAVNRLWNHFFGRGFVAPVDDFSDSNPPSHPELLNDLAREIVKHNYDLKFFIKAITASDAYQRASTGDSISQPYHFAHMQVKGLDSDQIYNSLAQAIGHQVEFNPRGSFNSFATNSDKAKFLERFSDENPYLLERETTVLQALALMNGELITDATKLEGSKTLAAVAEFPGLSTEEQVETLFLATLTRKPETDELRRFVNYVKTGGPRKNSKEALADVFWVLLNTSEFLFNH